MSRDAAEPGPATTDRPVPGRMRPAHRATGRPPHAPSSIQRKRRRSRISTVRIFTKRRHDETPGALAPAHSSLRKSLAATCFVARAACALQRSQCPPTSRSSRIGQPGQVCPADPAPTAARRRRSLTRWSTCPSGDVRYLEEAAEAAHALGANPGSRLRRSASRVFNRSYVGASEKLPAIQVDFPVPRGPKRKKDAEGGRSLLAYIVGILNSKFANCQYVSTRLAMPRARRRDRHTGWGYRSARVISVATRWALRGGSPWLV